MFSGKSKGNIGKKRVNNNVLGTAYAVEFIKLIIESFYKDHLRSLKT